MSVAQPPGPFVTPNSVVPPPLELVRMRTPSPFPSPAIGTRVGVRMFMPREARTGCSHRIAPSAGATPHRAARVCTTSCGTPATVAATGELKAPPLIMSARPPSTVHKTSPVAASSLLNPAIVWAYTAPPPVSSATASGLATWPKASGLAPARAAKSTRHFSAPSAASRATSTSRMPATNSVPPPFPSGARAGVLRIQSPFALAKNGTLSEPSHRASHRISPLAGSSARTRSA